MDLIVASPLALVVEPITLNAEQMSDLLRTLPGTLAPILNPLAIARVLREGRQLTLPLADTLLMMIEPF